MRTRGSSGGTDERSSVTSRQALSTRPLMYFAPDAPMLLPTATRVAPNGKSNSSWWRFLITKAYREPSTLIPGGIGCQLIPLMEYSSAHTCSAKWREVIGCMQRYTVLPRSTKDFANGCTIVCGWHVFPP